MKRGFVSAHEENNRECLLRARDYLRTLPVVPGCEVIKYRTVRRWGYGVVVNRGERFVMVWDAFSERVEKLSVSEFDSRLIDAGC